MALTVLESAEYREDLTDAYYEAYLDRLPNPLGLQNSLDFLQSGGTDQGLQDELLGSPEFFDDPGGTNAGFIAGLYTDLLQRSGGPSETSMWVNALNSNGFTTAQVAMEFLTSPEYDNDLAGGYFARFLERVPFPSDLSSYVPEIQGGVTNEPDSWTRHVRTCRSRPGILTGRQRTTRQSAQSGQSTSATLRPAVLPNCPADYAAVINRDAAFTRGIPIQGFIDPILWNVRLCREAGL